MTQVHESGAVANQSNLGSNEHMAMVSQYSAHNYEPLPVVISRGEGSWVWDVEGNKYLDCLSAYSALNFGHSHEGILEAFIDQARKLTLTSRAFQNDQFGPFCEEITKFTGMDMVLPMNTGAEAVETAIKTTRKWGYKVKGVEHDKAQIICCTGNFHGRTTTVISFSDDPQTKDGFGPFTPGFPLVEYGSIDALQAAITPNTVGFLFEPIQGEGGVVVPPDGFLKQVREICTKNNILMIDDEVQTGLGRTGRRFAVDHEDVKPDIIIMGKALGGGVMPVSGIVASKEILGVFNPGDHGSTFGGNPLACAVARKAIKTLVEDDLAGQSDAKGQAFREKLRAANCSKIKEVRGKGLLIGIEMTEEAGAAKPWCKKLMAEGMLCKDTVENVMRIAPPLNISEADLDWALERIINVLQ